MADGRPRVAIFDDLEYGRLSEASRAYRDYLEDDFDVDLVDDIDYVLENAAEYNFAGLHWSALVWSSRDEEEVYTELEANGVTPFIFSGAEEDTVEEAIGRDINFFSKPCYTEIEDFLQG